MNYELELKFDLEKTGKRIRESKKVDKFDLNLLQEGRIYKSIEKIKSKNNAKETFIDPEIRLENLKAYKNDLEKLGKSIESKNMAKLTKDKALTKIKDELWYTKMDIKTLELEMSMRI